MRDVVARMIEDQTAARDTARAKLRSRHLDPVGTISSPPTDAELRNTFWYESGCLDALTDVLQELDADAQARAA